MSIELQIRSSIFKTMAARAVQARLFTTCFSPIGAVFVDHADVASTPIELLEAGAAVRLRVPLEVFLTRRDDVLAAPNAAPAGAVTPAGTVAVLLEMTATGAVVSLRCVDADLGPLNEALGPAAPAAKAAIIDAVGAPMTSNLGPMLQRFGMGAPGASAVELVGGVVTIRFEPTGNAAEHLFPDQEWGMFLDGASVERLALTQVPADLTSHITSLILEPHWRPAGTTPHVDVDYSGKAPQVPDPFSGDVDGTLACDFSLTPTITRFFRTTVHWSLHIDLGDLVPGFIDNIVEDAVESFMDPTKFGGTPIGDHAFTIDRPLPVVSFGGARLGYASVLASPAGMTIGGPVTMPVDPGTKTLQPKITKFGLPSSLTFCRDLARSGSGNPGKTVKIGQVSTIGSAFLDSLGSFCSFEVISPGGWIDPYIKPPAGDAEIKIVIPSAVALGITEPVRLIVRTARGVRLLDLGTPPPVIIDPDGNVTNALLIHIPNCLFLDVEHGLGWAKAGGLADQTVVNPPLEHPDWKTYRDRYRGIDVQLVTLSALEPGELIQFRSAEHAVDVTADHNGRALVPVLLPVANDQKPASLIRVNRRSIAGHFATQTAIFVDQASLPAGTRHRLEFSGGGTAVLTAEFQDRIDIHEIGALGVPVLMKREPLEPPAYGPDGPQAQATEAEASAATNRMVHHELIEAGSHPGSSHVETSLNPQPLPPQGLMSTSVSLLAQRTGLADIRSLVAVPGFPEAPIALAIMRDGSVLVVDRDQEGAARVAGTFAGPIGDMDVSGDWAVAADRGKISIYRVIRETDECSCNGRH